VTIAAFGGVGILSFNLLHPQQPFLSVPDRQAEQRRAREFEELGIIDYKGDDRIPRLSAHEKRLQAHAKKQEDQLVAMLNGLKDKSRKEKLTDAAEAMQAFMTPSFKGKDEKQN